MLLDIRSLKHGSMLASSMSKVGLAALVRPRMKTRNTPDTGLMTKWRASEYITQAMGTG